ncbi:MAG: C45 family peptidase [Pirellulales bacterium]|nr:C45 family peptidase [Pirellulales bacterium]
MTTRLRRCIFAIWTAISFVALGGVACAQPKLFRYPEGKHGKGELRYHQDIPVLTIEGSPNEMGEQFGVLALKPTAALPNAADEFIEQLGWENQFKLVMRTADLVALNFPRRHLGEIESAAASSGWKRELLIFGNAITDIRRLVNCSAVMLEPERSATGGPLFGRNLDWPPVANLPEYTVVVVCKGEGKRAFASVTFPGFLGCTSAMNDAGLSLAMLDVISSKDGSVAYNPLGTPTNLLLRKVIEQCSTVEEAYALMSAAPRASRYNVAVCDRNVAAVFEVTPKNIVKRPAVNGICLCTNHFRTGELSTHLKCDRFESLQQNLVGDRFSLSDVANQLDAVNQGELTIQSMVFEPRELQLHLAFGYGPATRRKLQRLELKPLFDSGVVKAEPGDQASGNEPASR